MGAQRYHSLKQSQVKLETEEWERAARECLKRGKIPYAPYMADMMMANAEGVGVVRVVNAATNVGEAIEQEARINSFMQEGKKNKNESHKTVTEAVDASRETESKDAVKLKKQINTLLKKQKLLLETAYIQPPVQEFDDGPPDIRPAFKQSSKNVTLENTKLSRRYGCIECDPLIRKGLDKSARHMPMLIPPRNWTGHEMFASFLGCVAVMVYPGKVISYKTNGSKQQRIAVNKTPKAQLEPVFKALDTLGNTKWRINKKVLSLVDRIWASGGRLGGLVDRDDVPIPEEPDSEDQEEVKQWKWKFKEANKENSERHSQRCDVELKLEVARKMKEEEGFYFPHNVDFRGRAYPMHPYINHLGSDLCRGILEFCEGKPLGESGLRWLKIHIANLYAGGVDKFSNEDRVAFTESHLEDVFDSSDRPLEGKRWWLNAEDPFQCLGACMNLSEALRSPFPETAISHIPIHQDGSCNGLQHYAALGRDKSGAAAVNFFTGEKPADIYADIAARVLKIMQQDAEEDPETFPYAKLMLDQVDRKLVTTNALEEMFGAARAIMIWFGECAKLIASQNKAVCWTTPLGLPVVQPYRQPGRHLVKTTLQVLTIKRDTEKVKASKQMTAFLHSLDASHMMMTAVACNKSGLSLSFAGVHDSFWTHASDVDVMNRILREKFVELYDKPASLRKSVEQFPEVLPKTKVSTVARTRRL
ncbi:hypothetical protein Bca4012_100903 [Brassica carinata]